MLSVCEVHRRRICHVDVFPKLILKLTLFFKKKNSVRILIADETNATRTH